jgi:hypothetical protein
MVEGQLVIPNILRPSRNTADGGRNGATFCGGVMFFS